MSLRLLRLRLLASLIVPSCIATAADAQAGLAHDPPVPTPAQHRTKDPTTARVLGIIPGAGHLYAGEPRRAGLVAGTFVGVVLVGVAAAVGDCLASYTEPDCDSSPLVDFLVPAAMIGTIGFSIWDAGRAAERTNFRRRMPGRIGVRLGSSVQPQGRAARVMLEMTFQ